MTKPHLKITILVPSETPDEGDDLAMVSASRDDLDYVNMFAFTGDMAEIANAITNAVSALVALEEESAPKKTAKKGAKSAQNRAGGVFSNVSVSSQAIVREKPLEGQLSLFGD